jgi:hypothetical protein
MSTHRPKRPNERIGSLFADAIADPTLEPLAETAVKIIDRRKFLNFRAEQRVGIWPFRRTLMVEHPVSLSRHPLEPRMFAVWASAQPGRMRLRRYVTVSQSEEGLTVALAMDSDFGRFPRKADGATFLDPTLAAEEAVDILINLDGYAGPLRSRPCGIAA